MRRSYLYGIAGAFAVVLAVCPMLLNAQDQKGADAVTASVDETAAPAAEEIKVSDMTLADLLDVMATPEDALPPELQDPAFRKYVDISLLAVAWGDLNPVLMTDVALQLQDGERILLRSHRAVTSKELLKTAARIAGENNDEATLARIKAAGEKTGDKELAGQVTLAAKLGGSARDMTPELDIPEGTMSENDYADLDGFTLAVRAARLAGDATVLEALNTEADKLTGVTDAQRVAIKKSITDSLALAKHAGKTDPTVDTLEQIRGATRDFIGHFGGSHHGGSHHGGGHHGGGGHGHFGGHWGGSHGGGHGGSGHWGGHWGGGHGGGYSGHWGGGHGGHFGGSHHGHH